MSGVDLDEKAVCGTCIGNQFLSQKINASETTDVACAYCGRNAPTLELYEIAQIFDHEFQDNYQVARKYWNKLSQRLRQEGSEVVTNCHRLKLLALDGKMRETDCANTEDMFRIIQSIPSPKAEPLKRWLAKVGFERIQEIENPELATKRTRLLYKLKGYPNDWIEKRMRGIAVREELTDE